MGMRQFADAQRSDALLQPSACPGRISLRAASRCSPPSPPALPDDRIADSLPQTVSSYNLAGQEGIFNRTSNCITKE